MSNDRILDNIRIVERDGEWVAERWDGDRWVYIHSAKTYDRLVYWLDWNHPHQNIDTRATD